MGAAVSSEGCAQEGGPRTQLTPRELYSPPTVVAGRLPEAAEQRKEKEKPATHGGRHVGLGPPVTWAGPWYSRPLVAASCPELLNFLRISEVPVTYLYRLVMLAPFVSLCVLYSYTFFPSAVCCQVANITSPQYFTILSANKDIFSRIHRPSEIRTFLIGRVLLTNPQCTFEFCQLSL